MLQRRALSKFWLWSKYRGNLMYMIFLILLWLNFSITCHWNIPQQSTPATAVLGLQCNEAKQALCTLINSFFNPHKEKKAHCSCLNISRSLIHKCQLSHLKAVDFNSCLNSRQTFTHLVNFTFTDCGTMDSGGTTFTHQFPFYWLQTVDHGSGTIYLKISGWVFWGCFDLS